ncbi:hypothetical protein ACL02S_05640 [Nocardia sp. 004]|uniref:hypothetical protein n=1 Tax=Nocardia sp. 004 TaxID=3385978 RepID=UPI0039A2DBAF
MTSPDRVLPEGAYSAAPGAARISSLASAAARSAHDQMSAQLVRSYAAIPVNLATAVRIGLHEFAASFCEAVTGFTGGLIDLSGWARVLRDQAAQARAEASTAQDSAMLAEQLVAQTEEVAQATSSRVQVVIDGLPIKAYWETMNLTEESSIPRSLLHQRAWDVSDSQKTGYTRYSYQYLAYYDQNNLPVYNTRTFYVQFTPAYTPPANTLEGAYIRCRYSGGRKIATFMVEAVSSAPCELYVVVGRVQDNGDIRIEWVSDDQTPLITNSRFEHSVELPAEILFDVGESAFVGIQQCGSGAVRPLLGITTTDLPRAATAWPPRPTARFAASAPLAAGTTVAAGTLAFSSNSVPYVALSKELVTGDPVKLVFYQDFDTGAIPTAFARMSSLAATVSGGVFVVSGSTDGPRHYLYAQQLNYSDHMVTGRIINPTVRHAWLVLRSTADNKSFVSLNVTQNALVLYRYTDGTWTSLTSVATTVTSGEVLRVKAIGTEYIAQRKTSSGWVDVLTYTDTGNSLPSGPGYRYTGLGTERASWVNGGGWDYWKAEDL